MSSGKSYRAIGLMSGTSCDGIDVACIETDGYRINKIGAHKVYPYRLQFVRRLKSIMGQSQPTPQIGDIQKSLTSLHSHNIEQFCTQFRIHKSSIDVIGFHGHTIFHTSHRDNRDISKHGPLSEKGHSFGVNGPNTSSWQIGDGKLLANLTHRPVVCHLRYSDVKCGGEGAPLVPFYHAAIALTRIDQIKFPVVFLNIGGIANVTIIDYELPPSHKSMSSLQLSKHFYDTATIEAMDCGPGNCMLDDFVSLVSENKLRCDMDGKLSCAGSIDHATVGFFMKHPFFLKNPPKSLDRNQLHSYLFSLLPKDLGGLRLGRRDNISQICNIAATIGECSVQSIVHSLSHLIQCKRKPVMWFLCGGGRHNPFFVQRLSQVLCSDVKVSNVDTLGFHGDAIEAQAWAFLAVRSVLKQYLSIPTTTGVDKPITGGVLCHPERAIYTQSAKL